VHSGPWSPRAFGWGGNIRVGLEDKIHIRRGVLAESNARLVERAVDMTRLLGREPATPKEALQMLGTGHWAAAWSTARGLSLEPDSGRSTYRLVRVHSMSLAEG